MTHKAFLVGCRCEGDVCTCNDLHSGEHIIQFKDSNMLDDDHQTFLKINDIMSAAATRAGAKPTTAQKFTKLSEFLQTCAAPDREKFLDDIVSAAPSLPLETLKRITNELSAAAKVKEVANSKKGRRLARLHAAQAEQVDSDTQAAVEFARGELKRLGYNDMNQYGTEGLNLVELHAKAKEQKWQPDRIVRLKDACARIGLIEE
jgi:hypothetical protein